MEPLTWSHTDTDPPATAIAAFQVAKSEAWASIDVPTRARYLRWILVFSLQAGLMVSAKPRPHGVEGRIEYGAYHPRLYPNVKALEIASTVLRTPQLILPPGRYPVQTIHTENGAEPVLHGSSQDIEAGAVPLAIWVAGIAACTLATVLVAKVTGDVVDRQLARSEDTKKLIASQSGAVEIVLKHAEREERAGVRIPYDDAEMMTLESLLKIQRKIVERRQAPLPTPFAGAASSLDNALGKVGTGLQIAVPLAVAGGLYFLLTSRK